MRGICEVGPAKPPPSMISFTRRAMISFEGRVQMVQISSARMRAVASSGATRKRAKRASRRLVSTLDQIVAWAKPGVTGERASSTATRMVPGMRMGRAYASGLAWQADVDRGVSLVILRQTARDHR